MNVHVCPEEARLWRGRGQPCGLEGPDLDLSATGVDRWRAVGGAVAGRWRMCASRSCKVFLFPVIILTSDVRECGLYLQVRNVLGRPCAVCGRTAVTPSKAIVIDKVYLTDVWKARRQPPVSFWQLV